MYVFIVFTEKLRLLFNNIKILTQHVFKLLFTRTKYYSSYKLLIPLFILAIETKVIICVKNNIGKMRVTYHLSHGKC